VQTSPQRHILNIALLMVLFAALLCANMLSPVLEVRLFSVVGVFGVGLCVRHCVAMFSESVRAAAPQDCNKPNY
jgi:hypothetical protein